MYRIDVFKLRIDSFIHLFIPFPLFVMRPYLVVLLFFALGLGACSTTKTSRSPESNATASSAMAKKRQQIVRDAQKLVGSPYQYAGRTPDGFDCSGFTSYCLARYQIKVSPASSAQAKEGREVSLDRVQPGDIIVFGSSPSKIQHVAMVVRRSREGIICVHSTTSRGVIVENISTSSYWKPRILFARDMVGGKR